MNFREMWNAYYTLAGREIGRFMRIWTQTLFPPAITISLYFVIFGTLIGPRIGEMGGHNYVQFMVPGLVMMAMITNTYSNVSSSLFGMKFGRQIEDLLISPMPNWMILNGFILGGMVRGILVGIIVMLLSLFFADLQIQNLGLTLLVALMGTVLFSIVGFINGLLANSFDDISIIPTFILAPLIYLGGVFYSVNLLPDIWRQISYFNPILYIVNAFRYSVLGTTDIPVANSLTAIAVITVSMYLLAWYLLRRGTGLRS